MTRKRLRHHLYLIIGYLLLTLLMTYPLAAQFSAAIPGDGFDGWQNYWNLWWVKRALVDWHTNPFFTDYLYYPTGASLYFHTLNIFNGLLSLPIQLAFGLTVAYNFVILFSFVTAGYGVYLLVRYILAKPARSADLAAFLAGLVFAFSPFQFAHLLGHMQVFSLQWLPFYVLFLIKGLEEAGGKHPASRIQHLASDIWKPVLFLILTALINWYYVMYLLIFTLLYVSYEVLTRQWRRRQVSRLAGRALLIVLLFAIALSPLLVPMIREASAADYMVPSLEETTLLSADLLAFITPNEFHPLWGGWAREWSDSFTGSTAERMVFAGYVPLLLAAIGLRKQRTGARFWGLSLAVFFVLALGPFLHWGGQITAVPLPYLFVYHTLPFIRITRSVSRFDVMVMLSLAVLAGFGSHVILSRFSRSHLNPYPLTLILAGLICFEFLSVPYPMTEPDIPPFYYQLAEDDADYALLELPMSWGRPEHLLYQTLHGKRLVYAYISRENPLSIVKRTPILQHFHYLGPDIIAQDVTQIGPSVLNWLHIKYVIVNSYMMPPGKEREFVLRLVGQLFGPSAPLYQDERITVYRVKEAACLEPFLTIGQNWSPREMWDGQPLRWMGQGATLNVFAPRSEAVQLQFVARSSSQPQNLGLYLDERFIGSYEIGLEARQITTEPLSLHEGQNVLSWHAEALASCPIAFTRVDMIRRR